MNLFDNSWGFAIVIVISMIGIFVLFNFMDNQITPEMKEKIKTQKLVDACTTTNQQEIQVCTQHGYHQCDIYEQVNCSAYIAGR